MPGHVDLPVCYLIRAWMAGDHPDGAVQVRFLVERVDPHHRQAFDSFAAVVAYLRAELEGEELDRPPAPDGER